MEATDFRSGDALFSFDGDLVVRSWNRATEELVGVRAKDAIGRRYWEVLGGVESDGSLVCHKDCPYIRLARQGWPVEAHDLLVRTAEGRRRVTLSTISWTGDHGLFLHVMRPAATPAVSVPQPPTVTLTPRQLEVLGLLAEGLPAKSVATRLGIAVPTARNHIREILRILGAHSQLEAVAYARRIGLLPV